MEKVIVSSESLVQIADAIRAASNTSDVMRPSEMPDKIRNIMPGDVEFGEYTPNYDVSTFKAEHHLGQIPYMVIIWKDDEAIMENSARIVLNANGIPEYDEEAGRSVSVAGIARGVKDSAEYYIAVVLNQEGGDDGYGDTDTHFFAPSASSMIYCGGEKYRWMAVGF